MVNLRPCFHSQLLTWGAGKFGQLGNNARDDKMELQDITESVPPEAGKIVQVIPSLWS